MISKILTALESGLLVMRSNSRMVLVAILVFVFPLLFTWLTHSFFTTATANIETVDNKRLGAIHKTVETLIIYSDNEEKFINNVLSDLVLDNKQDLVALRVLVEAETDFEILYADELSLVGTTQKLNQHVLKAGFTKDRNFNRFDFDFEGQRIWQGYTKVSTSEQDYYIFSEQNFSVIDAIMSARQMQAYYGLTAILVFLIALAYWLNKQVDWHSKYLYVSKRMKERDQFTNMIAHEFRTPLTIIKGYASFLEESKSINDEDMRFVKNIHTATERLVLLVNDFLEVARLQSGRLEIEKTKTNLTPIINQVCDDLQSLAKKKNLSLLGLSSDSPLVIQTDAKRVTQILINIITNSLKYTESGSVSIECLDNPDDITILVKDTGTGISAEDQSKLFAPFTRVGGVDDTETTGTGLGMWITKQLVALLGGSIGVESIKGVGTHIVIKLLKE